MRIFYDLDVPRSDIYLFLTVPEIMKHRMGNSRRLEHGKETNGIGIIPNAGAEISSATLADR